MGNTNEQSRSTRKQMDEEKGGKMKREVGMALTLGLSYQLPKITPHLILPQPRPLPSMPVPATLAPSPVETSISTTHRLVENLQPPGPLRQSPMSSSLSLSLPSRLFVTQNRRGREWSMQASGQHLLAAKLDCRV